MEWLKAHWTWVAGIVGGLWLLSKLLGSSKNVSAGANVSTPAGVAVTYGGTNANDAAVQVAQINAQSGAAQAQVAGNIAVQQAQLAQLANQDTQTANMHIADVQSAAALAITNSNNAVSLRVTDNQTTLGLAQVAGARDVGLAQIAGARDVAITQSNNALVLGVNTNATNLAGYGIQAQVVNNQTAALTQIALAQTSAAQAVQSQYLSNQAQALANQSQLMGETYSLEASGQFNKGGEGGVNQVAAWGALTNPGSAAAGDAAAAATAAASANQVSNIISSIGRAVTSTLGGVTGVMKAA
jgi:hypothetical protein